MGVHSGENLAKTVYSDNADNNGAFVESLRVKLKEETDDVRFQGRESFVSCLAHVLNLIVKDIRKALKLRILSLWILGTPQRGEDWKNLGSIHGLKDTYIEYDVDTRWNSTYRVLRDGLAAKEQTRCYLNAVRLLHPFTGFDWQQLEQIARALEKFDEFTNLDLLDYAITRQGEFADLDEVVALAVTEGLQKYHKYYDFLDELDAYYIALILDPRSKTELIDGEATKLIVEAMKEKLHREYPLVVPESPEPIQRVEK